MLPHLEMHKKLVLEHRQQLEREAEQERLLAQAGLPSHGRISYLLRRIGRLFIARSSSMKHIEQIDGFFTDYTEEPGRESALQETRR
jgi:hypothetical protein